MFEELEALAKQIKKCLPKDKYRLRRQLEKIKTRLKKKQNVEERIIELTVAIEQSIELYSYRKTCIPIPQYPSNLPIVTRKSEIISLIQDNQVVVVAGETGSGKTTQLPKMCIEAGYGVKGKVGCTQPRRVAATSIASYLSEEMEINTQVSHKIRFSSTDTDKSYIKIMTDGILLMEIQNDRFLNEYDVLIIDEAHERTLNIDFILGYLKQLIEKRKDLRIIISSATIDTKSFSEFFNNAPIIEVSGRTYPVTVFYNPIDKELEDIGEVTIIDAAIKTCQEILDQSDDGDILIFMPGEADIRESVERLQGAKWCNAEVMPLFSRLVAKEQNKIFQSSDKRKIIVSTNIAETSLTIPGIYYVIDTGYARISRYCPRTKTKRLPIEAISRSSADQRKGRCGRVEDGICIRLYSEKDFEQRDMFTAPEIKRSDLSEVILNLSGLKMGQIKTFSFLNPPTQNAIKDGLNTLIELGAINKKHELTEIGRQMAKIPTDPRTARILLEAKKEKVLKEALIIVSALSIQDPKERPFEKADEADTKHKSFMHPKSDFLSYLNLWKQYHKSWKELKTQNKMRKFCKKHFLSFSRMREWVDLRDELTTLLKEQKNFDIESTKESYEAIHKSIISGFLGHICSKKEKNIYNARRSQVMIFPGSSQFNQGAPWIVAAELVETSKLFARIVATIDVKWIEPLAKHLVQYSYSEASWSKNLGQVIAKEKVSLWGLVLNASRNVHYGRIHRKEARKIFIYEGLVPGEIIDKFDFLTHNMKCIQQVQEIENKIRKKNLLIDDRELGMYYEEHLPDVVNVYELKQILKKNRFSNLYINISDILLREKPNTPKELYPDFLMLGSQKLHLSYCFQPSSEEDGITIDIPQDILQQLSPEPFEWLIEAYLEDKIAHLLKCLPKAERKKISPISETAKELLEKLPRNNTSLLSALKKILEKHYSIKIKEDTWDINTLPAYLRFRYKIVNEGKVIAISRNLEKLQNHFKPKKENPLWKKAKEKWDLKNIRNWSFGDLPENIEISPYKGGIPHLGYPGLISRGNNVHRTLFHSLQEAEKETYKATQLLLELSLTPDFKKLDRAIHPPHDLIEDFEELKWSKNLKTDSFLCIKKSVLQIEGGLIRTEKAFSEKRRNIREDMWSYLEDWYDLLYEIVDGYDSVIAILDEDPYYKPKGVIEDIVQDIENNLKELFYKQFLTSLSIKKLRHYPRYLKAMETRLITAKVEPSKDRKKWKDILTHLDNYDMALQVTDKEEHINELTHYKWLIEEFKISVFAPKLKTAFPVSQKRLNQKWKCIEDMVFDL